jgi:hypothetical protein
VLRCLSWCSFAVLRPAEAVGEGSIVIVNISAYEKAGSNNGRSVARERAARWKCSPPSRCARRGSAPIRVGQYCPDVSATVKAYGRSVPQVVPVPCGGRRIADPMEGADQRLWSMRPATLRRCNTFSPTVLATLVRNFRRAVAESGTSLSRRKPRCHPTRRPRIRCPPDARNTVGSSPMRRTPIRRPLRGGRRMWHPA